ncbi:hypothetical protein D3C86_1809280 [compost metagenome]
MSGRNCGQNISTDKDTLGTSKILSPPNAIHEQSPKPEGMFSSMDLELLKGLVNLSQVQGLHEDGIV